MPEHALPYIKDIENPLTGDACYRFRCSLLHQDSSQHSKSPFSRIIFIEPGATTNVIHYGQMTDALCIDLNLFCREIIAGARLWLQAVEYIEQYMKNYEKFVRRHPKGLRPYIAWVPVLANVLNISIHRTAFSSW